MFQVKLAEVEEKHIAPRVWNSEKPSKHFESLQDFKTIKPRFSQIRRGFLCSKPRFSEKLIFYFWVTGPQKVVPLDFNHPDCISILVPILPANLGIFLDIFIYFGDGLWPFWGAAWLCRFDSLSGENRQGNYRDGRTLLDPFRTESQLGEIMAPPRRVERGLRTRGNHCLEV